MEFLKDLRKQLAKKGINLINTDYYNYIDLWSEWYRGDVSNFHHYNLKLADGTTAQAERLTMNMPKKVCEDFSKLLWSEKAKIHTDSEANDKKLWEILDSKKNNFSVMLPIQIELGMALGTSGFTEYKNKDDEVMLEYLIADSIIPYKYDNSHIEGMCVINRFVEDEKGKQVYYTHVVYHEYEKGKYTKLNELYKSKDDMTLGKEIPFEERYPDVENPVVEETDYARFQIFKPSIANNLDNETPMGISIFANQIDKFKAIDTKYDSFTNEFILGKKRIVVDATALKSTPQVNDDGTITNTLYLDKNDTAYVAIRGMEGQPVKEIDMSLRYNEHITSINAELNWLSAGVGLGQNFYSFDSTGLRTATEVVSENSDTYRSKEHLQIVLGDVLYDLCQSVLEMAGIQNKNITIEWDDSIIVDKDAVRKEAMLEYNTGLISKQEYFRLTRGLDDKQAEELVKKLEEEQGQAELEEEPEEE